MEQMNWTEIVLGLFTLLSTCGWFVSGRKHRQEIESLKADNRQKDMNLSKDYVTEWRTYIAEPLQREVGELRTEIAHLRHAIQAIDTCAHRDSCPVINELQHSAKSEVVFTSKNQETSAEAATVAPEVSTKSDVEEVIVTKEDKKKHSIFISYSHEDNQWLIKVLKNLKPLQRYYDNVDSWSDKKIMASDVWKDEIDKALKNATIAILLISSDFEASDFITNEELQPLLDKAQADGTKIMPLIVRPCAFFEECGLSKYQAVNDPKKPLSGMTEYEQEMALVDMVKTIKEIIKRPVESGQKEVSDNYVKGTEASEEEVRGIVKNWRPE